MYKEIYHHYKLYMNSRVFPSISLHREAAKFTDISYLKMINYDKLFLRLILLMILMAYPLLKLEEEAENARLNFNNFEQSSKTEKEFSRLRKTYNKIRDILRIMFFEASNITVV